MRLSTTVAIRLCVGTLRRALGGSLSVLWRSVATRLKDLGSAYLTLVGLFGYLGCATIRREAIDMADITFDAWMAGFETLPGGDCLVCGMDIVECIRCTFEPANEVCCEGCHHA